MRALIPHLAALAVAAALFAAGAVAAMPACLAFARALGARTFVIEPSIPWAIVLAGGSTLALPVLAAEAAVLVETWRRRAAPPLSRWLVRAIAPAVAIAAGLAVRVAWDARGFAIPALPTFTLTYSSFELTRWAWRWGVLAGLVQLAIVGWRARRPA